MKTIPIRQITPSKGLNVPMNAKEDWVMEVLHNLFPDQNLIFESIKGQLVLRKTNQVIDITGDIEFSFTPLCARCGKEIPWKQKVHFVVYQAPIEEAEDRDSKNSKESKEVELTKEDLHFTFYENEEIRIDTVLNDEIALEMPYNFKCKDTENCHLELPKDTHISMNDASDPRWAPLKDLKKIKH